MNRHALVRSKSLLFLGALITVATLASCGGSSNGGGTNPVVSSVAVTAAASDVIAGGAPVALVAVATFSDSTTADVTSQATWTTSLPGQVDVAHGSATAPLAALVGNRATLSASFGGQQGSAALRVVRGPPIQPSGFLDPLFPEQWNLKNTRQKAFADNGGTLGADLRLASAWELGLTGRGVKVAIVDDGLEKYHPDLFGNMVDGSWNFPTDTNDPSPTRARQAHGTAVAGLVAMIYGNGQGGMGVAPSVTLNGYVLIDTVAPFQAQDSMFVRALGSYNPAFPNNPWSDDVAVFNQSYGYSGRAFNPVNEDVEAQYSKGVTTLRGGKGAIYVRAAGNDFRSIVGASAPGDKNACERAKALGVSCANASQDGEAALPFNVVVGSLGANDKRAGYSTAGSALWVSAPGGGAGANKSIVDAGAEWPWAYDAAMVTTDQISCDRGYARTNWETVDRENPPYSEFDRNMVGNRNPSCLYTNEMNGTSSAAPNTTGAVALLLEANPDLTWRDVKHILAASARKVDEGILQVNRELPDGNYVVEQRWVTNEAGYSFHNWYGFGAVDVDEALKIARSHVPGSLGAWTSTGPLVSASGAMPIQDFSTNGAVSRIALPARVGEVEAIVIHVGIRHPRPSDLGIELTNPAGTTKSIILNMGSGLAPVIGANKLPTDQLATIETNAFYGEDPEGEWTLRVVDGYEGEVGWLTGWAITVYGH